jgi:hypothetical protein
MMDIYYQLEQFTDLGDWVPVDQDGAPSTNGARLEAELTEEM